MAVSGFPEIRCALERLVVNFSAVNGVVERLARAEDLGRVEAVSRTVELVRRPREHDVERGGDGCLLVDCGDQVEPGV